MSWRPLGEIHGIHRSRMILLPLRDRYAHDIQLDQCSCQSFMPEKVFYGVPSKDEVHGLLSDQLAR